MCGGTFEEHPDVHWISLKGLRGTDRICIDGIHFNDSSNVQFALHLKRKIINLLSTSRHVPGIDDPLEAIPLEYAEEQDDDSHLGAVRGSFPED